MEKPTKTGRMVAVNDAGHLIGEGHPRAVLSDREVVRVLELREEGFSIGWIASRMEVSKSCVQHIVEGRTRWQTPTAWRRIHAGED